MKISSMFPIWPATLIACAGFLTIGYQAQSADGKNLDKLAVDAVSPDASIARPAIASLRAEGPAGLKALFDTHAAALNDSSVKNEARTRLMAALDEVGQQRDCYASKLYWYKDFDQAKAAARNDGKPILSLRLLGNLNEEFSCANSRFFRTTLYANVEVSKYLRENFVLHWQSVRPVPRITIDMGDGRKIERTITGNSIHYVLDANGNPIDALPGLYGAKAFLAGLNRAVEAEQQSAKLDGNERKAFLNTYHQTRLAEIQQQWSSDLAQVANLPIVVKASSVKTPDAIAAAPIARGKFQVEAPLLRAGAQSNFATDRSRLEATTSDATWKAIAALHASDSRLDVGAYTLVSSKQPLSDGDKAMRLTASKSVAETPMLRMIRNLERSIAEDTVRNEYLMHTKIHEWLANNSSFPLDTLNSKVYAELFLTPDWDPWLGLAPADTFSALDKGGLVQSSH